MRQTFCTALEPDLSPTYPFETRFLQWGLVAAVLIGTASLSLLTGFSVFVLFAATGMVWRRNEPPVLAACLGYQWVSVVAGYLYRQVSGIYPGMAVRDLEGAVFFSLLGLMVLAAGIRSGLYLGSRGLSTRRGRLPGGGSTYDVRRLFWLVVLLGASNWLIEIKPMVLFFDAAQLLYRLLEFRSVFLILLLLSVLQQRRRYGYAVVALLYTAVPKLASTGSALAGIFIVITIVLLSQWRPWERSRSERRWSQRVGRATAAGMVALMFVYLGWEGGVKSAWRRTVLSDEVSRSRIAMVRGFLSTAAEVGPRISWASAPHALAARASSGVGFFSHVLPLVPDVIPHEHGRLTLRAIQHTAMPRVLFPDKPNLGSDSWLIRRYAGLPAAGLDRNTSIGLGYMAEFYIDFAVPGMFIALFAYGALLGFLYAAMRVFAPSHLLYAATVTVMFLRHFMTYDGEIAKLMGGTMQAFVVFALLLGLLGPRLDRYLAIPIAEQKSVRRLATVTVKQHR